MLPRADAPHPEEATVLVGAYADESAAVGDALRGITSVVDYGSNHGFFRSAWART